MIKKSIITALVVACSLTTTHAREYFDTSKDLLIAQFDLKPDMDDVHSAAALACMLEHSDLAGVEYFVVAGTYGNQGGTYISNATPELYDILFGSGNWVDAHEYYYASRDAVLDKAKATLDAGGQVWVQEAGQSDFTRNWLGKLLASGVSASKIKNNVNVVQHSQWNEDQATSADLAYVKDKATYIAIDDGNKNSGATPNRGANTPNYKGADRISWVSLAKNPHNPNVRARQIWEAADDVADTWDQNPSYSPIDDGGIDFSDCVENWYIFNIGGSADSISKFWNRYVTNGDNSDAGWQESDSYVSVEIESLPQNGWSRQTSLSGYSGSAYYRWTGDDDFDHPGTNGEILIPIEIHSAGNYQLFIGNRIGAGNDDTLKNDTWVAMSGEPISGQFSIGTMEWTKLYNNGSSLGQWSFDSKTKDHDPKPIRQYFSAGRHLIAICARSKDHCIDKVVLFKYNSKNWENGAVCTDHNTVKGLNQSDYVGLQVDAMLDVDQWFLTSTYDVESHPNDDNIIREVVNANVGYIKNNSWIRYNDFNFGERGVLLSVHAATPHEGGTIEARLDSSSGTKIGQVEVTNTGSWGNFENFTGNIWSSANGIHDLYFVFKGNHTGGLFNVRSFSVKSKAINGYQKCCNENQSETFSSPVDVAYGANGKYVYKKNVTGTITFDNNTFGSDPIPGVAKKGYYRTAQ